MPGAFTLDGDRILLGGTVLVYLERCRATPAPLPRGPLPRPHGASPLAVGESGVVVAPLPPGEAVWLGFQPVDREVPTEVRVRVDGPRPVDVVTGEPWEDGPPAGGHLICPPATSLAGPPVPGGRRLLGADGPERLTLFTSGREPGQAAVKLVRPEVFTSLTGRVCPPLDADAAFKGTRLP